MYLLFLDKLCPGFSSVIQESCPGPGLCSGEGQPVFTDASWMAKC